MFVRARGGGEERERDTQRHREGEKVHTDRYKNVESLPIGFVEASLVAETVVVVPAPEFFSVIGVNLAVVVVVVVVVVVSPEQTNTTQQTVQY